MFLQTDEQTIDDLRIFGKRESGGIYELYNHTHTRGGEMILRNMFRQPLCNREEINRRSALIGRFAQLHMAFPFNASLFDMAEKYLANQQDEGSRQQQALSEKDISNGVAAVIELMQAVSRFVQHAEVIGIAAYAHERAGIAGLLSDPVFEPAIRERTKGKLSYAAVAAFDILFRIRERHKIEKLLGHLYQLDVYLSVAKVAVERKFVFPEAHAKEKAMLHLEGVYHPELATPVGNDLSLHEQHNLVFLTGANMAGKSTFLRAISTAVYLAHMGFPVAARKMSFSVMDGMYTTVNLPDNLGIGASHFYAEVLRVKKVATELNRGKSLFVIFDELFRGTNVKDAYEATVAITKAFACKKNSLYIISSHIVEAGEALAQQPGIGFQYLPTRMNGHTPAYTYTLEKGITADRHGMIIIRNEGILEILKHGRKTAHA